MKRIVTLLALILAPALSFAQTNAQQNEAGNTYLPANGNISQNIAVDRALRQIVSIGSGTNGPLSVIPISNATGLNGVGAGAIGWQMMGLDVIEAASTATVLNLTAHIAQVGDIIRFTSLSASGTTSRQWSPVCSVTANTVTLCTALSFTPIAAQDIAIMRATPIGSIGSSSTGVTSMNVNINSDALAGGTSILKLEDSAHATGDAGVLGLAVTNESLGSFAGAVDNDYSPIGVTRKGIALSSLVVDTNLSPSAAVAQSEDVAIGANAALVKIASQRNDALALDTDTTGDAQPIKGDALGRTITTLAPAAETFYNCSASATGVVDVAIKAAVASNRSYVTSITCSNTAAAVSTELEIRDGTTVMDVGYVASTTLGESHWTKSYPVPLRGSVNTAVNVRPVTTASATRCCVQGYISVN